MRMRCTLVGLTALVTATIGGAAWAQSAPTSSAADTSAAPRLPTVDSGRKVDHARSYRMMQVVGGSIFAISYGSALIGALLYPGPDVQPEQEKMAHQLLIPVAGPWLALAQDPPAGALLIPMGICQVGGLGLLSWGIVGAAMADDEPADGDVALSVVPLSPDGTQPGLGVFGRF